MSAFPKWLTKKIHLTAQTEQVQQLLAGLELHTVCESARCPNIGECYGQGTATFLILGNVCTRNCRFCAVESGLPPAPDTDEPRRVAQAVEKLGLRYVVITSVTRDDLPDGGAMHFAETIAQIRAAAPQTAVEVLVPDFEGAERSIAAVAEARPDVFGHNLECVPSLYRKVRPEAQYDRSLELLQTVKNLAAGMHTKSGLMLGLGESKKEVISVLEELREVGCDMLTLGQYLRPSKAHVPVRRFVPPQEFQQYEATAAQMGFWAVAAGPFVRSSYRAGEFWEKAKGGSSAAP